MKTLTLLNLQFLPILHTKAKLIQNNSKTLKQKKDINLTFNLNYYLQLLYSI